MIEHRFGRRIVVDIPVQMAAPDAFQTFDRATLLFPTVRHMHST
jgi:hypothetical protein